RQTLIGEIAYGANHGVDCSNTGHLVVASKSVVIVMLRRGNRNLNKMQFSTVHN
ncbi:hypothetical protein L195_g035307, partial [Trifolium pratense]